MMADPKFSLEEIKHREETVFHWTFQNFKELYDTTNRANANSNLIKKEKFIIGEKSMRVTTHWDIQLARLQDNLGIVLRFCGPGSSSAKWNISLKSTNGEFITAADTPVEKYAVKFTKCWGGRVLKSISELQNEGFLPNGELCLKFNISVYSTSTKDLNLKGDLSKDFKNGLDSGIGTDITFVFEEEGSGNIVEKIKAHRAILSLRSSVFATMFGSGMNDGEIKITDISPKAMQILLKFIYCGDVDEQWGTVAGELFCGANKYELHQLSKFLCENIESVLTLGNVWYIRKLASLHKLPQVLKSTMKFIKENTERFVDNIHDITFKPNNILSCG